MYIQTGQTEGPSISYVVVASPGFCVKIIIFKYLDLTYFKSHLIQIIAFLTV